MVTDEGRSMPMRVGRYEILMPIGSGGMANVYLARFRSELGVERLVAIKVLRDYLRGDPELNRQLLEEARLSASLRHPNAVPVVDAGEDEHGVYLVMDYVEGDVLSSLVRLAQASQAPMTTAVKVRILSDALTGLHAAHELVGTDGLNLGLVHRDVSPQNILVGSDGVTRLTDFGIAKTARGSEKTRTGLVKGKVGYMAPEQVRGKPLDRRCDVWAAGVVAWELFAERRLFEGEDDMAVLFRIVSERAPSVRSLRSDVPEALAAAIDTALNFHADDRYPTVEAFRQALLRSCPEAPADAAVVAAWVQGTLEATLELRREQIAQRGRGREREPHDARQKRPFEASVAPLDHTVVVPMNTSRPRDPRSMSPGKSRRGRTFWTLGAACGGVAAVAYLAYERKPEPPRAALADVSMRSTPTPVTTMALATQAASPAAPATLTPSARVTKAVPSGGPLLPRATHGGKGSATLLPDPLTPH